jgi:hypothetical protein
MYMFDELTYLCWVNLNFIIKENELKPVYYYFEFHNLKARIRLEVKLKSQIVIL